MLIRAGSCLVRARKSVSVLNYCSTPMMCHRLIEVVPPLGESITEGTIASWKKIKGDFVNVDDVVVVVETDKVTVDIKATHSGVIVKQIAKESVVVGGPLFEVETSMTSEEANELTTSSNSAPDKAEAKTEAKAEVSTVHSTSHSSSRTPSIKFLGKRSKERNSHEHSPPAVAAAAPKAGPAGAAPATAAASPTKPHTAGSVDVFSLKGGAWFGRPVLTAAEIEAIESGGASLKL